MGCFFSFIIPVYNTEKYLHQCVDSVLTQGCDDLEIILVNDGSTDASGRICDDYAKKYPEKIKAVHKENGGLSSARNAGIRNSCGKYLIFLDSDDFFLDNECTSVLKKELESNTVDVLCFKSLKYYPQQEKYVDYYGDYDITCFMNKNPNEAFLHFVKDNKQFACACNKAVSRDVVINNGLFFQEGVTAEDVEWSLNLFESIKSVYATNKNMHIYRQNVSTSITASLSPKKFESLSGIVTRLIDKYSERSDAFSNVAKSFMAFQYAILLFNISCFDDYKNYAYFKKYDYILKYSVDKKTKITRLIYKIFGFNGLMRVFRLKRRFR